MQLFNQKKKMTSGATVLTTVALVVGCHASKLARDNYSESLAVIPGASECSSIVTVGEATVVGAVATYPQMIRLGVQSVVCGDRGIEESKWKAIGMGAERESVFLQLPSGALRGQVRLAASGAVEIVDERGASHFVGRALEPGYAMPITLEAGVQAELRFQGRPVKAEEIKNVGVENLEVWVVSANH